VVEIRKTARFTGWLDGVRDNRARAKVLVRLERARMGNFGDVQPVGSGVSELRIDYGPGYRVYFIQQGIGTVVLLAGGTKLTQARDIKAAIAMAKLFRRSHE
jgi:putative addiction module killer protein